MLLQTVKSRNLWLWGEIIKLKEEVSYKNKLLEQRDELVLKKGELSTELVTLNKQSQGQTQRAKDLQEELEVVQASLNKVENQIKIANEMNTVDLSFEAKHLAYSTYTTPFKITALQSVDVTWDNPIGESYGLTSNFLQSWHNKPVVINFKGISYMGAFGGETVGNIGKDETLKAFKAINNAVSTVTGGINSFTDKIQSIANHSFSGLDSEGKFEPVIDEDIKNINDLLSNYGEGLFTRNVVNTSPYIYLLMENSNGADAANKFVTFVGHIKNFQYSERADKPFLYDFSVQFVGEPVVEAKVEQGKINAKTDSSSIRLTAVATDTGYSLGYGW